MAVSGEKSSLFAILTVVYTLKKYTVIKKETHDGTSFTYTYHFISIRFHLTGLTAEAGGMDPVE